MMDETPTEKELWIKIQRKKRGKNSRKKEHRREFYNTLQEEKKEQKEYGKNLSKQDKDDIPERPPPTHYPETKIQILEKEEPNIQPIKNNIKIWSNLFRPETREIATQTIHSPSINEYTVINEDHTFLPKEATEKLQLWLNNRSQEL